MLSLLKSRAENKPEPKPITRDLRPPILKLLLPSDIPTATLLILKILIMSMLVLDLIQLLHLVTEWIIRLELGRIRKLSLVILLSMQVALVRSLVAQDLSRSLSSSSVRKWVKSENFRGLLGPLSFPLPLFLSPYSHSLERLKRSQAIRSVNLNVTGLTESLLSRSLLSPRLHLLPTPTSYRSSTDSTNLKWRLRILQPYSSRWILVDRASLSSSVSNTRCFSLPFALTPHLLLTDME